MKSGYPPIIIKKEDRLDYYEYLEMANQGDVKPFIRFIARCAQRTLEEYILMCNHSEISVDDVNKMIRSDLIINDQYDEDYLRRISGESTDEVFGHKKKPNEL